MARNIKEAMYIRVNDPYLNMNLGKFQLPHVWDQVLKDTLTLHLQLHTNYPQHHSKPLIPPGHLHHPPTYGWGHILLHLLGK